MSSARAPLVLQLYITDTFRDLQAGQRFMEKSGDSLKVLQEAEEEMDLIRRNNPRSKSEAWNNCICYSGPWSKHGEQKSSRLWFWSCSCCGCCRSCSGCCRSCSGCCRSCVCTYTTLEEIEKKLHERLNQALKNVQQQLDELKPPLLAIERLAVTSEQVFQQDLQVQVDLRRADLRRVDLRAVRRVLSVVKAVSPWVTVFKQDQIFKSTLEIPLEATEPLQLRLQAFISALKNICRLLQDSAVMELQLDQAEVRVSEELSEEQADKIQKLQEIRDDKDSRLVFLLGDQAQTFTKELLKRESEINEHLEEMLQRAEKLEPTCCPRKADGGRGRTRGGADEERGSTEGGAGEGRGRTRGGADEGRGSDEGGADERSPLIQRGADEERVHIQGGADEGRGSSCWRFSRKIRAGWEVVCSRMIAVCWCLSRIVRAGGGVVSSLVGIPASIASLVGLAERFVTLEVSRKGLKYGLILSCISLFINLFTMVIDKSVNKRQKLKGDDICEQVKGHRKVLQRCLDSATFSPTERIPEEDQTLPGGKLAFYCLKAIDIIGDLYAFEEVKSITMRKFLVSVITNPILLVWEPGSLIYRCKGTGRPPVGAQWLRVRVALWKADMEDWKEICESLERGQPRAERNQQLLNTAFF